jgi:dTDP-4-amino-4,6-dideoxygalactose transaminase
MHKNWCYSHNRINFYEKSNENNGENRKFFEVTLMIVPFVDLKTQYLNIRTEIDEVFRDIFENTAFICGKYVSLFEKEFTKAHEVKYFSGLSSGTDAIHLMLWASGIGLADEIIVPVNTFIATAEGVNICGAKPVFVDNEPQSYNVDVNKIEEKITGKTKAILPVHLYGQPADMESITNIAKKHNLLIFEDACQAHLAEYKGKKVGNFGEAAAFSFFPGKNLGAYGEAGGIATNDENYYQKIIKMRAHGSIEKYIHEIIGHNYRMDEIQAGVLLIKLKYLKEWTRTRIEIAKLYCSLLKDIEEIICPIESKGALHVYHLFVIRVLNGKRDELREFLKKNGVDTGLHYPIPIHLQKAYKYLGYKKGDFPVAEKQAGEILSLPIYAEMEKDKVEYVCKIIKDFYNV